MFLTDFAARSRALARLASLAQIGEIARRLVFDNMPCGFSCEEILQEPKVRENQIKK